MPVVSLDLEAIPTPHLPVLVKAFDRLTVEPWPFQPLFAGVRDAIECERDRRLGLGSLAPGPAIIRWDGPERVRRYVLDETIDYLLGGRNLFTSSVVAPAQPAIAALFNDLVISLCDVRGYLREVDRRAGLRLANIDPDDPPDHEWTATLEPEEGWRVEALV